MKRYFAAILAATMMLTMTMTAFATEGIANNDGTITINNAAEGMTYKVYKMLGMNAEGTYVVEAENPWYTFLAANPYVTLEDLGTGAYKVTLSDMKAADVQEFTSAALAYAEENGIAAAQSAKVPVGDAEVPENVTKNTDGTYSIAFHDLELGYYLLDSVTDAICVLGTDTQGIVSDKSSSMTLGEFTGTETVEIGGTINYTVVINAPQSSTQRKFTATFDESIKLNTNSIKIKKDGADEVSIEVDTKSASNSFSFIVPANSTNADITYEVTYSAELIGTANISPSTTSLYKNEGKVQLKNENDGSVSEQTFETKTYEFHLRCVDQNNTSTSGEADFKTIGKAEFRLYRDDKCMTEIKLVKKPNGSYRLVTSDDEEKDYVDITTIERGVVRVQGLESGTTYYLKEVKTPNGYIANQTVYSVLIEKDMSEVPVIEVKYSQGGSTLPSTGGVGTAFCYILGTALMLGAGAVLVIRRRMFFE